MHLSRVNAPLIYTSTGVFSVSEVPSSCAHKASFFFFFSSQPSVSEREAFTAASPLKALSGAPQANWITAAYHRQRQVLSEYKTFVLLPSRDSVKAPNLIPKQQMLSRSFFCVCFLWGCHNTQTICTARHRSAEAGCTSREMRWDSHSERVCMCV